MGEKVVIYKKRAQAILLQEGHVLMARHYDLMIAQEYWCFPGGAIEAGETPEQAVIREVKEETNLDVKVIRFLGKRSFPEVQHGYAATFTYLTHIMEGKLKLGYDPEQAGWDIKFLQEIRWIPIDAALLRHLNYFISPDIGSISKL